MKPSKNLSRGDKSFTAEEAIWYLTPIAESASLERYKEALGMALAALRAIQRLGKFGQLFLGHEGCPRGAAGRSALPLEEEVLSMSKIKDIDGGEWIPVNADALTELVDRYKILCAQQETRKPLKLEEWENHKPLTLEELREMDGEPVWMQCTYLPKCSGWEIAGGVDTDFGNRTLYCAGDVTFRNYGDAWLAYRHKPKEN